MRHTSRRVYLGGWRPRGGGNPPPLWRRGPSSGRGPAVVPCDLTPLTGEVLFFYGLVHDDSRCSPLTTHSGRSWPPLGRAPPIMLRAPRAANSPRIRSEPDLRR